MTPEVEPTGQYDAWRTRWWRLTGRLVVLLWLAVLLGAALFGEKESHLHDLESALDVGSVSAVEITGLPGKGSLGDTLVTLRWEGRFVDRYAEVAVGRVEGGQLTQPWARNVPHIDRGLVERLRALDQDVHLIYVDHHFGSSWEVLSWRVPRWVGVLSLAAWASTFMLVAGGPEPWRATRAAWVWLVLLGGSVGVGAFLLLGGPLGIWQPRDRSRRLTGGWAFLLALVLGGGRA